MTITPNYDTYDYTSKGAVIQSQSIVECRLVDWAENRVLAVSPVAVCGETEVLSGEIRYGGKLLFSVAAASQDGTLISAERGVEFTHRARCESAAPAQQAEVFLTVEKTERRTEGRSVVLSAVVTAHIRLRIPSRLRYLSGGEGVVCDLAPVRVPYACLCRGRAELEEEFDTDYVSDVLLHSEQIYVTRAVCSAGCLEVSGEVVLGVLAGKDGGKDAVSYERTMPFRAEIVCDEAVSGMACRAVAKISSARLTCACDEDKGRCRILAQIEAEIYGKAYRASELLTARDAFCIGKTVSLTRESLNFEEPVCAFTATERVLGTAVFGGTLDENCVLQAAALCGVQAAAAAEDGCVTVEGVFNAYAFYKDGSGTPRAEPFSLPFSFPVRSDRASAGMRAEVTAVVCGVAARQKQAGELEAEGSLKLYVTLYSPVVGSYVRELTLGEDLPESDGAVGVYFPSAGDTLWETAKKLGKTPDEVQKLCPQEKFPLTGKERIVFWRQKKPNA